jgi:5-formyltetrahydrofolate cyclo-ligase
MADRQTAGIMDGWDEIKAWRGARRVELVARRESFSIEERRAWGARITALLTEGFPMLSGMTVGFCWPYRGEFDARFAVRYWRDRGARAALPEVKAAREPLRFRIWWPGAPMKRGVYGIPFPDGTEIVQPDAVLAPMNGYDAQGYRLGYGGGYFDRTLAALAPKPLSVGVTYSALRLATIHPQPHDVPMDFVVTEAGISAVQDGALVAIDPLQCRERAGRLAAARGLPRRTGGSGPVECSSPPCYAAEFPGYFGGEEK